MANKIQIRRGQFSGLPQLDLGEPSLTTDTGQVYFGGASGNIELKTAPPSADRTIYVATTALGGQTVATQGATGLELASGTATGTTANKLVNSGAAFTAALVNKTLYNKTDDTWAKVIAVDSPTQLTLSADVMASGELYAVASAVDNIPEAFLRLPDGYVSNITLRISPGAFADDVTFIGKNAGGNFSLSVRGSTTGTTTISGKVDIRQRLALRNLTFTNKIRDFFGADVSWYTCVTSGASKLYVYSGAANYFEGSTIVFGNDPGSYIAVSSTITKGYTMYVASTALGGNDAVADGLQMYSGTATSTTSTKLVDSAANFGTDVVGKTLYNSTDDTWAKVTARDSATQLSLSADIMASGEGYVIASAFSTIQKAVDMIPGMVNCNTTVKISNEVFSDSLSVFGKAFSGSYTITVEGSTTTNDSGASTGTNTTTTLNDTGKAWTVNAHAERLVYITGGTGAGQLRLIKSNTATALTVYQKWATLPDNTSTYKIWSIATSGMSITTNNGQKGITANYILFDKADVVNVWVKGNSDLSLIGCKATGGTDSVLRADSAAMTCNQVVAYSGPRCLLQGFGKILGVGLVIRNMTGYGIYALDLSWVYLYEGNEIRNNGNTGVFLETNCAMFNIPTTEAGRQNTFKDNTGWGVYADSGSQASGLSSGSFSGNTSGTYSANATKYAYAG